MSVLSFWLAYWLFFVRPDLNVLAIWVGPSPALLVRDRTVLPGTGCHDLRPQGNEQAGESRPGSGVDPRVSQEQGTGAGDRLFIGTRGRAACATRAPATRLMTRIVSPSTPRSSGAHAAGGSWPGMNLKDVLDEFRKRPWQKKLLILDIGQIGTDRDLGVFANDFTYRLKQELDKNSETTSRSFAPARLASLAGPATPTALRLRPLRSRWDEPSQGRSGIDCLCKKTRLPMGEDPPGSGPDSDLVGKPGVQLPPAQTCQGDGPFPGSGARHLRRPILPGREPEAQDLWKRLVARYRRSDVYADQRPYRYAPLAWREYQETLLRAERLYRAGLFPEGGDAIKSLDGLEQELKNPFPALPKNGYPSLEMGLRIASDSGVPSRVGGATASGSSAWPGPCRRVRQAPPTSPSRAAPPRSKEEVSSRPRSPARPTARCHGKRQNTSCRRSWG